MARALPNRRRRQLEQLELRQMLAGDVTVDVQDGSLMIWGDDDDNALSIVADPRRANTFRIVPQTDTTINGQATTQLVVSGVSSIRATLGGGNDAVLVQGNPRTSLNAIDFRCDDGVDRVYLRQLRVEDSIRVVALEAEHADFITFENVVVDRKAYKIEPAMVVRALGSGSEVNVIQSSFSADVLIEVGHEAYAPEPATGVVGSSGTGKVKIQDLSLYRRFEKANPILRLQAPGSDSEVSVSHSSFEGPVRLEVGSRQASSLGLLGQGAGRVVVEDVLITSKVIDKSSPMLALIAPGGGSQVRVRGADVEGNVLIEVGHDASPPDPSSGVASGGGSGKVHVRDLHFTKWVDKTSPSLMLRALGGGSEVTLASSSFEGPVRLEVGSRQASFLGLVGGGAGKVSVSDISISSKLHIDKIWPILAVVAPGGGSQVHVQGADVEGNVLIEVGHDASPSDPTGVVGVATGPGAGKANLQDLHFHKRIDKSTPILLLRAPGGGSEVSVSSSTFEGPVRLEVGSNEASSLGLVGQGAGKVSVSDISITSADLDKSSPILALVAPGGGSEIRVRGADVEGNVLIEVGHEASPPDAATGVGGGMGAGKAHLQDLHFRKWIDKSSPILMLRAPGEGNEVSLSSSSFEGPVRMEVGSHRSRGLTAGGGSRVSITDLAIALKEFDKSSPVLALVAPSGGSEVRVRGADVEGNVLIEVGHEADSSSPPDPASGVRSGMGTGKANLQDLHFHKRIDKSTPILLLRAPGGDSEVSLSNSSFEGPVRLEVGSSEASTLGFSGLGTGKVSVRDLSITADAIDKSSPILAIQAPGSGSRVRVRGATVEGSVSIEVGHEPLPPDSATGVSGGMGAGKAQIQDLHLTKWIDKSSPILMLRAPGGGSDVSVSSSTFDGPVRLEVGSNRASSIGLVGHGAGKVAIQDLSFTRRIDKSTPLLSASLNGGGSQIDVQNVDVPGLARIQLGGSNSVDANLVRSNVARILDSNFGAFDLQSLGEISDRVLVERCLFNGEVSVGLSGGDDYLQVVDSIFSGSVLFDGGDGMDTLVEQGNRFRRPPARLNWEQ
ncbi:MAG: type VI secretion system tube protein Hcp [Planctomycetales bacterium]|nr:type VI secretion system tube protein Hcp [Planctomycetales bacterium]